MSHQIVISYSMENRHWSQSPRPTISYCNAVKSKQMEEVHMKPPIPNVFTLQPWPVHRTLSKSDKFERFLNREAVSSEEESFDASEDEFFNVLMDDLLEYSDVEVDDDESVNEEEEA